MPPLTPKTNPNTPLVHNDTMAEAAAEACIEMLE